MRPEAQTMLARKYAQACINIFLDQINDQDCQNIKQAKQFLRVNHKIILLLGVPSLDFAEKKQALDLFADHFELPEVIKKLLFQLLKDNRTELMHEVLRALYRLYNESKKIMAFEITSSHQISDHDIGIIECFLAHTTKRVIIYEYKVNSQLIAGIRMQSDTFLWEHSIRKHLRKIQLVI